MRPTSVARLPSLNLPPPARPAAGADGGGRRRLHELLRRPEQPPPALAARLATRQGAGTAFGPSPAFPDAASLTGVVQPQLLGHAGDGPGELLAPALRGAAGL